MKEWKYSLELTGKQLRNGLKCEERTAHTILRSYENVIQCLKDLKLRLKRKDKELWEDDIDNMIEDLEIAKPESQNEWINYEEEEENFNYYLKDFYDLCDSMRVWIGL